MKEIDWFDKTRIDDAFMYVISGNIEDLISRSRSIQKIYEVFDVLEDFRLMCDSFQISKRHYMRLYTMYKLRLNQL